jgi:hypothetical protein
MELKSRGWKGCMKGVVCDNIATFSAPHPIIGRGACVTCALSLRCITSASHMESDTLYRSSTQVVFQCCYSSVTVLRCRHTANSTDK